MQRFAFQAGFIERHCFGALPYRLCNFCIDLGFHECWGRAYWRLPLLLVQIDHDSYASRFHIAYQLMNPMLSLRLNQ